MKTCPFALAILLACATYANAAHIWVEGEDAASHTFQKHGWYDNVDKSVFSGRQWLSHYHASKSGEARYDVHAKEQGRYVLWLRANPFRVEMDWRLGQAAWQQIDFTNTRDRLMVSPNPDHRFIGWVRVAEVDLTPGDHRIAFRIRSKLHNHGGIDCFLLTTDGHIPTGAVKPGEGPEPGPDVWFPVAMQDDRFDERSLIDMSHLLHTPAGRFGHVKRAGDQLCLGDPSRTIKFWGVGANIDDQLTREQQLTRIRYLAKHGVNMVRQHPLFGYLGPLNNGKLDPEKLDAYDWWFAQLKAHGIYVTWSVFYPLRIDENDGYDPQFLAELKGGSTSGVVNMSRQLQDMQLAYLKVLLEHRNPYTKLEYKDDPALAVIEVHNEDCIFWHWPLNDLAANKMPRHAQLLRQMFSDWAKGHYRTTAALRKAWGGSHSLESGELSLFGAWQLKGDKPDPRMGDFIRFLTDMQRSFYERREKELRQLGFQGVTVTTAWRSGGPAADAANLYCDTAMDMIDRHNYFGGGAGRHRIVTGEVHNNTHLAQPGSGLLSIGLYQVEDRPFAVSEWNQNPPNQYKLEAAPLVAFYGMGLQGWDASCHFLNSHTRIGDGWPGLSYYCSDTPHYVGQFPALAFAIHRNHVAQGPIVAARRLRTGDLFTGRDPLRQDFSGGDYDAKSVTGQSATPVEALAVGRVTASFEGGTSQRANLRDHLKPGKEAASATGQLHWDIANRRVTLRGPKTHALIGFTGASDTRHTFGDVTLTTDTPFVSILFTPLDDQPLRTSRSILLTAMARDRQTGTSYSEDGSRLEAIGGPPLLMEPVQADITLAGNAIRQVTPLDHYGVPKETSIEAQRNRFRIDGNHQTYYYHITR